MTPHLSVVVEGQSEEIALPRLVFRVCSHFGLNEPILRKPFRIKRQRVTKDNDLGRALQVCATKMGGQGALLVLLDADEDCAKDLALALAELAEKTGPPLPKAIVIAVREIEAWLIAAAESLRGQNGLRGDIDAPDHPEDVGSPKAWLKHRMTAGRSYGPVVDLPVLVRIFDLDLARARAPSFDKFCRALETLLGKAA